MSLRQSLLGLEPGDESANNDTAAVNLDQYPGLGAVIDTMQELFEKEEVSDTDTLIAGARGLVTYLILRAEAAEGKSELQAINPLVARHQTIDFLGWFSSLTSDERATEIDEREDIYTGLFASVVFLEESWATQQGDNEVVENLSAGADMCALVLSRVAEVAEQPYQFN